MKKIEIIRVFCLVVVLLILSIAPALALFFKSNDITKQELFGQESEFKGILTVWNIDTFEGGSVSKSDLIESIAREFEKNNKGLFVFVENMSVEEFSQRIENESPDIISFGSGLFSIMENYCCQQANNSPQIYENILKSVMYEEKTNIYPWCMGGYYLLSSYEALQEYDIEQINLVDERFNLGKTKNYNNKSFEIKSLTLGTSEYHSSVEALKELGEIKYDCLDEEYVSQTTYQAYVKFCNNKAAVLLGTHRDLTRLKNKLHQGVFSGLKTVLIKFSDMLQYAGVVRTDDEIRTKYSNLFCQFLQSDYAQNKIAKTNLLPVIKLNNDLSVLNLNLEIEKIGEMKIKKIY